MVSDRVFLKSGARASLLDLIIQTAPDAIITADAKGIILSFSPAAEAMFGYKADEMIGQNVSTLMSSQDRGRHDSYMHRYLTTGEKRIIGIGREVRAQRKSGEVFIAELAIGELQKDEDRIFTAFIREITDRVEAVRNANRLQRALDRVARIQMLGEMSTALAHEINQPLTAISNFAGAAAHRLRTDPTDIEEVAEYLDQISDQALRAGEIMKRMKRMVDRGQANPRPEDINEIVSEAVRVASTARPHDELQLTMNLAKDLPLVYADRVQIQQVLVNLLRNAVEAIEDDKSAEIDISTGLDDQIGDRTGGIEIRSTQPNHRTIEVIITDNGPGLPDEMLRTAFNPFTSSKVSGLGVGLAVCRSIIQSHGGRIWAKNNPEGGASLHFTLPAAEDS